MTVCTAMALTADEPHIHRLGDSDVHRPQEDTALSGSQNFLHGPCQEKKAARKTVKGDFVEPYKMLSFHVWEECISGSYPNIDFLIQVGI